MGCPIDALAIYRRAISEPEKFERAKTWGGGTTVEQFEKAEEEAAKKVDSVAATAHLQRLMELLGDAEDEDDEPGYELDLLDLPIRLAVNENSTPGLQLAIQYALDSDEGKEALDALYQRLADVTDDDPEHHWSLPAARLMIATVRDPEAIEPIAKNLSDRLPPVEEIEKAADTPSGLKYQPLWDLFSAAQFCMASDLDVAKEAGSEICDYLEVVGQATREANAQLALASLTGSGTESLQAMLDSIGKTRKPGQPLRSDAANSCLRIAKSAAKQGHVELSCRALALALGQGPPLRQVGTVSDAFAIQTSRARPNPRDDNGLGVIVADVCGIADDFSDATGHQIGQREPSEDAKAQRVEDVDGALKAIALSFQQVVLPEDRGGAVFPYAKPIVSVSNYDPFRGDEVLDPQSLSIALARAANLSGQTEAVVAEIRERMSQKAGDQQKLASVFVDVARAARDEELLAEALEAFVAAVDSDLPAADAVGIVRGSPTSITSQMQQDSYRKSVLVNAVLHAAWPIVFEKDFPSKQLKGQARELFQRTAALIESDGYTSQRHRVLLKRLREEMITSAAETGDSDGFAKLLKAEMASLAQQYATYTGTTDYEKRALDDLLMRLMDKGLINKTPSFVRKLILRARKKRLDYQSATLGIVCIEIRKLPPEQQYEVLREITLGIEDDQSVAHWGAFVRYSAPPKFSERQVPRLEAARQLPTCTSDVPVADTLLLLADLAAELGKSETLAGELAEISKQRGDDADLAAKLTMLAAVARSDSGIDATETLQAVDQMMETVAARISENKPTKNDRELQIPMLEWYVVLRALDAGWPSAKAEPIMRDIKAYAVRSQQNLLVSAISRVIALNGIGRAAGGTTESPLKHFAVVALPPRFHPDLQNLKPLFAINDEGWLSGTSGYGATQLMLKYPLTGTFTVSAEIKDGGWGESDIAYGGLLYQPAGFNKKARVTALTGATVEFPVPSIEHNKPNVEAVKVTSDEVLGLCNGETYVTDIKTASYPWAAVTHHLYRTTQLRDIRIEGEAEIPREVDMIDPTMRGWAVMNIGRAGPDPRLPIGPKQDRDEIVAKRKAADEALAKGRPDSVWSVKDGELGYPSPENAGTYNPDSQLQYLRPLFDGETVELSFWWEWKKSEVHPTVGRLALMMTKKGVVPKWLRCNGDLTSRDYVILSDLDPRALPLGTDNLPKDKSWNTLTMMRKGDSVEVELNSQPLAVVPVTDTSRPGVYRRKGFDARIQSMKLTGDWPTEVPTELMERAD